METNLEKLWQNILNELKPTVSTGNFNAILKPTMLVSLEDDIATIATGKQMILGLLQNRFSEGIKTAFKNQTGKDIDLLFIVKTLPTKSRTQDSATPLFEEVGATTDA